MPPLLSIFHAWDEHKFLGRVLQRPPRFQNLQQPPDVSPQPMATMMMMLMLRTSRFGMAMIRWWR